MKMKLKIYKFKVNKLVNPMFPRLIEERTVVAKNYSQAFQRLNLMILDKVELLETKGI